MGLSLVVGPAHAGKVALLLDRFVDALDRDPWLIVPNRVDVERVERELARRAAARCSPARSARSTRSSRTSRGSEPGAARDRRRRARRLLVRHVVGAARLDALGPSARFAGFTDALAGALTEIEAGLLDPERPRPRPRRARRAPTAPSSSGSGRCDRGMRAPARRRAADERARRLGRRAGARVRLRGPDRRGVAAARGARGARRGARLAAVRARPGRVRVALPDGRPTSRALAGGDIVELPPGSGDVPARRRSPTSSATSSTTTAEPAPLDGSIRFLEGAGRRATLELVAETVLELVRDGTAPEEIAVVCPVARARARASIETAFGALGVPVAIEAPAAARQHRLRAGAALAAPLRVGQRHPPRALRVPAHAVLRPRPRRRRLPRGAAARTGRASAATARSRRRRSCGRAVRCRCSSSLARRTSRSPPRARSCARCSATPTGSARRP